jgi:type I restriction enzyme S subunit
MSMEAVKEMVSYEAYARTKPSGADWLGPVPEHWQIVPGFTVIQERAEKNLGMKEAQVLSLSYGRVIVKPEDKLHGLVPESYETYQVVYPGDIIIRPTDLQNDKTSLRTGQAFDKGIITSAYLNVRPKEGVDARYVHYYLHAVDISKVIYMLGSGLRQNLDFGDFKRFSFLVPPLPEQTRIAAFLDRKCGQIDQAIAQKERLIALLKERRQVLVQQAVTKGLDPKATMKDSGVGWLGEVPAHWEVRRLKYVVQVLKRIAGELGHSILSITQKGIKVKDIESGEGQIALDYTNYQRVYQGEFAMNHMDLITGYVDISKYDGVISPDYRVFKPITADIHDAYLLLLFQMCYKNRIFYPYGQGVSQLGRWRFPAEAFNDFLIPLPPMAEQQAIAEYLTRQSSKEDAYQEKLEASIAKLKEYRSILINAAVTGKIKVPEE